jgi:hypothetical protein
MKSRQMLVSGTAVGALVGSVGFLFLSEGSGRVLRMILLFAFVFFTTGSTSTIIPMFKELDSVEISGTMISWSNFSLLWQRPFFSILEVWSWRHSIQIDCRTIHTRRLHSKLWSGFQLSFVVWLVSSAFSAH